MAKNEQEVTGWTGWVYFAGLLLSVAGILQMISGLTALLNDKYYVVTKQSLLVFDYTTWGWVHLVMGLVVLMAGMAVMSGRMWGRVVAVFVALLSILAHFAFMSAYPLWSILVIVMDVLIIYALTVHGAEAKE